MKMKRSFALPFFAILVLILSACAVRLDQSSEDSGQMDMDMALEMEQRALEETSDQATSEAELDLGEKIIENASLQYETTNFEETTAFINEQIDAYGGLLENTSRGQSSSSYGFVGEYISLTIRLPHDQLHPFINELNGFNDLYIQTQDINRVDVTKVVRDNETRIAILREEEAALREMLQEQGSLEEVLQIRTRLSEVVAEREIYENENRNYNEQVEFSTVYLHVQQTNRADTRDVSGFWNRLSNAFVDAFYRFIAVAQSLVIGFIYLIPYLIILGVTAIVIYFIVRRVRKDK